MEAHPVATLLKIHEFDITIKSCYVCDWRHSSEDKSTDFFSGD